MPPNSPWGKKQKQEVNNPLSAFPELKPTKSPETPAKVAAKSQYEEIQEEELYALSAIYDGDFTRVEKNQGAWKKSDPCFEIKVKSSDEDIAMTLVVTMTATYPKSPPLLHIKGDKNLRDSTRYKLQKVIEEKPKELLPEEQAMIMEIVNACQEVLEDAAQAKVAGKELPSLEEERAIHEAAVAKLAQQQKDEDERKRRLESLEEERMLDSLVQDELNRQKAKAKETKKKNRPPGLLSQNSIDSAPGVVASSNEMLLFDQPITIQDSSDNLASFQVVTNKVCIRRGPISKVYTVRPISQQSDELPNLVLKQTNLKSELKDSAKFKAQLQNLENELEALKKAKHQNILNLFDFKVQRNAEDDSDPESGWTVSILTEFADKGSLEEFLDIAGSIGVAKVRSWTIELLDALRFLHDDHGIVHQDVHAGNVLLVREPNGEIRPKLADAGYERRLHNLSSRPQLLDMLSVSKSAYWFPPEIANNNQPQYTQKTDVWDFGVVFLQMIFGLAVIQKYASPVALTDSLILSESLNEFVLKLFKADSKRRPRAFELTSFAFLATDAPILEDDASIATSRLGSVTDLFPTTPRRQRHDSFNTSGPFARSRYKEDFVEEGRLGKGGFGEVVKARKKLDGQIYAIKKITQKSSASLTEVLKEVRLLSQLSHPSVVMEGYYNTWTEEIYDGPDIEDDTTTEAITEESISEMSPGTGPNIEFGMSTGGLDFMSSQNIEFGYDDDSESDEDAEDDETDSTDDHVDGSGGMPLPTGLKRLRSNSRYQRNFKTILYISMEYCEKRTLRDLIKRGLSKNVEEIWRLFRQVLEGLNHIHSLNVVHRDLKPENIFIDAASNVRIGDFGLATSGQYTMADKVTSSSSNTQLSGDMTRSIGTAFYVAPEVKSSVTGSYTSKVDMYSLGIIFFEMCYRPLIPGMDRAIVGENLRRKEPKFPPDFAASEKPVQTDIILSLINHIPKERPSCAELLHGGKLPVQMESETIRQALASLTDSRSPYYEKLLTALFSIPPIQAKDFAWDMGAVNHSAPDLLLQGLVRQKLVSIFRRHGAVETPRSVLFPKSSHYGPNAVQLLDQNGMLVQLPYDLTLPHARFIAKQDPSVQRSFSFGPVFRDRQSGGQPQMFGEVDFDIVSLDTLDLALKEAEVIKVLDEIVASFPAVASTTMCFHLNHSDLLSLIFDFCRIEHGIRPAVADSLSKLNIHSITWQKIKAELRSPLIGMSATSVDDLQKFDFRDTPHKAFQKLKTIFEGTDTFERASSSIAHLKDVVEYTKRFDVRCKIYINPLSSLKEKFCKGGIIFSCLYDRKVRDVFAAGGRYDSLIREHRPRTSAHAEGRHAVGFNLAWEKLARLPKSSGKSFLKKPEEEVHGIWNTRRCDVLVASFDAGILRTVGVELVQKLWDCDISAELAKDARSPEDLLLKYRDDNHSWILMVKQDSVVKAKTMGRKDASDVDLPLTQVMTWLKSELRERDHREGTHHRQKLQRHTSATDTNSNHITEQTEQEVHVLMGGTKSKKSNRRNIVEQAQSRASAVVQSFLDGPIAAIETTDQVVELIRDTRLSDPESWRKVTHSVPTTERRYIGEIHELLQELATRNKDVTRNAFVYNFRTGLCVYYDLKA